MRESRQTVEKIAKDSSNLERDENPSFSPAVKRGRKARVLVIDDEPYIREVLSMILAKGEHQVTLAESGEEGLRIFRENEFDLVLTDLGMPKISGWEVCHAIKKTKPQTPVGMITGWGTIVDQARMEGSGVDFVICKPFDLYIVLNKVAEFVS